MLFENKIQEIEEALSFKDTFKAPDAEEKDKRLKEIVAERLAKAEKTKLSDGTWHVHGNLNLSNLNLESLKGLNITIVDASFDCSFNKLTTLEGCPKVVKGSFYCFYNKKDFTIKEVRAVCDVGDKILV